MTSQQNIKNKIKIINKRAMMALRSLTFIKAPGAGPV
jgi:hypothetical protein